MQTPGTNKMDTAPVGPLLLTRSLPMMFSMMMQALYNLVDSIFIAHYSEAAFRAVSLTYPIQTFLIAISIGTYLGMNAILGRTLGQGRMDKARSIVQHGALLAVLSCLPFLLAGAFLTPRYFTLQTTDRSVIACGVDYMSVCLVCSVSLFGQQFFEKLLEAAGFSLLSMLSQLLGAAVNLILDPLLIFGAMGFPALGAKGAALATVTGQFAAMACGFLAHQYLNKDLRLTFAPFRFERAVLAEIYQVGLPAILIQSFSSLSIFMMNRILLPFSATAASLLGVYYRLQNFVFMPVYGLSNGLLPILSYNIGAEHKTRVLSVLRSAMLCMAVMMLAGTVLFQLLPRQLFALFDPSGTLLSMGARALRITSLSFLFEGFCLISQTGFQCAGRGVTSLLCCLTRQIIVLLPAAYLLSLCGSISAVWLAYPITGIASGIVCLLQWRDVFRKNISCIRDRTA